MCERAPEEQPAEKKNTADQAPIQIPEAWSREVAKNVANLPSPVEANASVPVSVGLPDVVPDIGFSAPVHLHPPALGGVGLPALGPPSNPFKLPKIGF